MEAKLSYKQLSAFVPELVKQYISQNGLVPDDKWTAPMQQDFRGVLVFADIAGFTKMCEVMAERGPIGVEKLGENIWTVCVCVCVRLCVCWVATPRGEGRHRRRTAANVHVIQCVCMCTRDIATTFVIF
jgi:hypothetical protein